MRFFVKLIPDFLGKLVGEITPSAAPVAREDASQERWFETASGRKVFLSAVHIQSFAAGHLEGRAEVILDHILGSLEDSARRVFPADSAVYLDPQPVDAQSMPALACFCDFVCFEPVNEDADMSSLTVVWYADDLSQAVPDFLRPKMRGVEWEAYASDGCW